MGKTYVAGNLMNSGKMQVLTDYKGHSEPCEIMNYIYLGVSKNRLTNRDIPSMSLPDGSGEICCLDLERGCADGWFGLGYALALGKPFFATVEEDDLPHLLSLPGNGRIAFPAHETPFAHATGLSPEDRACLAATDETDRELKACILITLASQDLFYGAGSLKCHIRNTLPALTALAPALESLLEEGLVREQYDVLGGEEVAETYAITAEGLAWLRRFEEANDPAATENPDIDGKSLLFFAD